MADVPMLVISDTASSERRITPSWTISTLKAKLEHITGVPPSAQTLFLAPAAVPGATSSAGPAQRTPIAAADEDATQLAQFALSPYAELHVVDTRPPGQRPNYTDTSAVEKYVLPAEAYAAKADSVLAWKKAQKLGRFDPDAPEHARARIAAFAAEAEARGIAVGKRCRVGGDDTRRGVVQYVGDVPEIGAAAAAAIVANPSASEQAALGAAGTWVGVELDEPVGGKNDGSIGGTRYWGAEPKAGAPVQKKGVFVRPERVEVGSEFGPLDDLDDMEEI
ncbi:cell polarity protein [Sporothrix brasiliensis 5110]|uniref:Cell polarity protein n=1 Tax=Sporothrix brasiliensis 5110 TaxID=1398154 RepID=A0A0C2FKG5_9PEZI|nr:cell polarity protein [Sporothrix brasiliensis 5110]KIH91568.1 cell polarity protein [Sporothrix brasiliensis 5110]